MTPPQPQDEALVQAIADGDTDALAILIERHQAKVIALAYRLMGNRTVAEDVAQDVFIKIFKSASRYKPTAKFTTWLYRIVYNRCIDLQRRSSREIIGLPTEFASNNKTDDPSAPMEQNERAERIKQAIAQLPERQRTTILLSRYEDLSYKEIAGVTGWSHSAVESLLVRAYANLRKSLQDLK